MALGDETEITLDPKVAVYLGPDSDTWTYTQGPSGDGRIKVSTVANDPSSVADKLGASLVSGGRWQSGGGTLHVYITGNGTGHFVEGI